MDKKGQTRGKFCMLCVSICIHASIFFPSNVNSTTTHLVKNTLRLVSSFSKTDNTPSKQHQLTHFLDQLQNCQNSSCLMNSAQLEDWTADGAGHKSNARNKRAETPPLYKCFDNCEIQRERSCHWTNYSAHRYQTRVNYLRRKTTLIMGIFIITENDRE